MRTLYIHFGLPKTGTTTIQNTLFAHRERLLSEAGLLYPSLQPNLTTPLCTIFQDTPSNHIENRIHGRSTEELEKLRLSHLAALERNFLDCDWRSALISAEGLSNLRSVEIARLRDWAESIADRLVVLYCVREPVAHTRSVIQQLIKGGDLLDDLYATPPLPNFQGKIRNAVRVFGKERLCVFDFESDASAPNGLVFSFAKRIGISDQLALAMSHNATTDNESMSMEGALLLDRINQRHPMFVDGVKSDRRSSRQLFRALQIKGSRFDIPEHVKRQIYDATRDDVEWLNNFFSMNLYREPLTVGDSSQNYKAGGFFFQSEAIDSLADLLTDD